MTGENEEFCGQTNKARLKIPMEMKMEKKFKKAPFEIENL